jgi:hypothetical protein
MLKALIGQLQNEVIIAKFKHKLHRVGVHISHLRTAAFVVMLANLNDTAVSLNH